MRWSFARSLSEAVRLVPARRLVLISLLAVPAGLPAAAQGQEDPEARGAKGPISRAELFERLKKSGPVVSGYVIQGC